MGKYHHLHDAATILPVLKSTGCPGWISLIESGGYVTQ